MAFRRSVASLAFLTVLACVRDRMADSPLPSNAAIVPANETHVVGSRPRALVAAKLDGDRWLDVAVANSGDGTVTILSGTRDGFRNSGTFPAGREPSDIAAADVDRDGDADLIVANHETSTITVLSNDGGARFAKTTTHDTGATPHLHSVIAADLDEDGWIDLAVESSGSNEIRILRGGSSGFGAPVAAAAGTMPYYELGSGDVTGDGISDVVVPGHGDQTARFISRNGSAFALAAGMVQLKGKPWSVATADIDADKRTDFAVVETDSISVWLARAGSFVQPPWSPIAVAGATTVAIGNLDGDEKGDVVIGPWEGDELTLFLSRTSGTSKVKACGRAVGLAIADLDGDGAGDIIASCATEDRVVVIRRAGK